MDPQTIDLSPLDFRADVGAVSEESRTVDLTWSTGADVERFSYNYQTDRYERYIERLSLDPKHVDMSRLASGTAPVLDTHSAYSLANVIGVVENAALDGKRGTAAARFPKAEDDPDIDRTFRKIRGRIIRNVSVGYRVTKYEVVGEKAGVEIRLATRWMPYEISMVPMGADMNSRTRSTQPIDTNPCVLVRRGADADRVRRLLLAQARR